LRAGIFVNDGERRVSTETKQQRVRVGSLGVGLMASAFMTAGEDLADQDLAASYELGSLR
jgi:hypothetical protein